MTKLSVNINKVATVRNARGGNNPDLLRVACDLEAFGSQGITVHPRPDERHIRFADVRQLKPLLTTEFNIEGYPTDDFLNLCLEVEPAQVTLVPDAPSQITSNAGWDTKRHFDFLKQVVSRLHSKSIRVSIFIDPVPEMADYAKELGADRVELYTEPYASTYAENREVAIAPYVATAERCRALGLGLNAGHDLSLQNLHYFATQIPWLDEVSIGHALICDALYLGFEQTVKAYRQALEI
ncbi:MAG: pyridoxine 5'-phosphate synthase [Bacteroidaceae bacterium]|nr:pyridoxine 5'-phosphate synthase [Bacteroidaceae bacterium]